MKNLFKKGMATLAIAAFMFSVSSCGGPSVCECMDIASLVEDEGKTEACKDKLEDMDPEELGEAMLDCAD